MVLGERDAYAVLGVGRSADDETIATAYRLLARRFHPDIAGESATRRMMAINAAFDAISSPEARARYDGSPIGTATATQNSSAPDRDDPFRGNVGTRTPRDGTGGAGPPPGRPSGSVLDFGRHVGWSIGEIARVDPGYLVWLTEKREGRPYLEEIDAVLRRLGHRADDTSGARRTGPGRGVFGRG
jgi:curved DNA-binding protein CbpA